MQLMTRPAWARVLEVSQRQLLHQVARLSDTCLDPDGLSLASLGSAEQAAVLTRYILASVPSFHADVAKEVARFAEGGLSWLA